MIYKPSKTIKTISFFAFTTLLVGLSAPSFAGHKGHGNSHGNGHGHNNQNSTDPDDYSLSWNQECTAVTINVEEGGKPMRRISYFDSAGNGPTTIKSTREMPFESAVDLSTTELQSYISAETGGTIWIQASKKGKKAKRHSNKGQIELNVPSCSVENLCPFTEELNAALDEKISGGYPYIEVRFYGTPKVGLSCDAPDSRIAVLIVEAANDADDYPVNYLNPWKTSMQGVGDQWGSGVTFVYDTPEQARACAIYLGCTE